MGNFSTPSSSNNLQTQTLNIANKISPNILLIILIIAIIFFISGLLHLLIRLLLKPTQNNNNNISNDHLDHVSVLQGQLQQLFHLHDSGVDQSYIDTLPLFYYEDIIIGLKRTATATATDPEFDCVVCLCEFESHDKLRLLPKCSHAFHMECIDTWLLSHSTCPLCRSNLLLDYVGCNPNSNNNPIVCVLESNSVGHSREIDMNPHPHVGSFRGSGQVGSGQIEFSRKSCERKEEKILNVKLGKFRNVDNIGEGTSENNNNIISDGNNNLGSRRCYSMGSFAYVLDETTLIQVPVKDTLIKKKCNKKTTNRAVMSEYGCDSRREFNSIDKLYSNETEKNNRRLSFSISKIWEKRSRKSNSEFDIDIDINVSEKGVDEETQSCYSVDSIAYPTTSNSSSNRRTLLWLMGRQNKVFHNHSTSLSSNV